MGKAVSTILKIGAVVAGVAAVVLTGGAALGVIAPTLLGVSAATLSIVATGLSIGASLLAPKAKAPAVSPANADRLTVSIDLRTPRKIIFGTTAMATDLRDQEWSSDQTYLHRFVVTASHKASGYRQIWFDDKLAWTSTGGVQGEFVGYLNVTTVLEGSAGNAINIGPRMGSSRRYTGCAYVYFRYKLTGNSKKTESPFSQSIPTRVTIVGDGAPIYDPRLDSTAGGSGPQRANDQSTWSWNADAARNPALQLLWYLLGWRIAGKLAVGKGIPAARIDLGSFITAANMCDEPVAKAAGGTEPRYRSDGIFSEADDLSLVADNLKSAMNAVLDDVDGRWRLSILHNDLATPRPGMTAQDVLGAFTWDQTPPLSSTINVIRGGYTDPSTTSLYQLADYPEIRIDGPDGIERPQTVNLPLVQSQSQAKRLIKLRLQRAIFGGTFKADFQVTAWRYVKGDVFPFTFAPLGFEAKLFRIAEMGIQVDGRVSMILREEHADIYLAEDDENAAIVGVEPTVYQPALTPILQDLSNLNDVLDRVTSDGYLSGVEKRQVVIDHQALLDQRDALAARYVDLGSPADITAARDAAFAGVAALDAYLAGLAPAWDDPATSTPIVPADYRAAWGNAYQALSAFAAAITGRPGADGSDGLPGVAGADGVTYYDWYAYANAPDGSIDFAIGAPAGRAYQGVARRKTNPTESTNPADYSWTEYRGPPFGVATRGQCVVAGRTIIKNGGAVDWDSDAYSTEGWRGGCALSFRTGQTNLGVMAGINTDPTTDASYGSLDYAWYLQSDGGASIYESGTLVPNYTAYSTATTFQITYDNRSVRYLVDGVVKREVAVGPGALFYFDSSFLAPGGRIVDLDFGPMGSAGGDGLDGSNGLPGNDGRAGIDGSNGQTPQFHFAWANSLDGSVAFTTGAQGGRVFQGVYVDYDAGSDSANYLDYTWSRFTGLSGEDGSDGEPGPPGPDGQPTYVHKAYATAADGSAGFSTTVTAGKSYLGLYIDNTLADSADYHAYAWSLIKGADGAPAITATLSVSIIPVSADYTGATKAGVLPRYSTLTVKAGATDVTSSCSVTLTPSDASTISASYSGGNITVSTVNSAGFIDVAISYAGTALPTQRIQLSRTVDSPPPASQSSGSGNISGAGPISTTYSGPSAPALVLRASSSGTFNVSASAEYYAEQPASGSRSYRPAVVMAYRAAGGGAWSYTTEVLGSTAISPPNTDPNPGSFSLAQTISGLTAGGSYELGPAIRKYTGNSQGPSIDGQYSVTA